MSKEVMPKGSIIYKLLIVILAVVLLFSILYPKKVWDIENKNQNMCRENMSNILYAELTYLTENNAYNDTLSKVVEFIKNDTTGRSLKTFMTADSIVYQNIYSFFRTGKDSMAKAIVDSLLAFGKKYDIDTTSTRIIDSLKTNPLWAEKIDSIALFTLDNLNPCPTIGKDYIITVNNDSAIKVINIQCPIDSMDIVKFDSDFKLSKLGGLKLKNHGKLENGEADWKK